MFVIDNTGLVKAQEDYIPQERHVVRNLDKYGRKRKILEENSQVSLTKNIYKNTIYQDV